jgi:adenine-specific DNA-methyltransferase
VYRPFLDVEHDVCTLFFDKNKSFESCSIGKRFYENYMLIDNNNIMKKSDFIIEEYEFTFNLLLTDLDFSIIGRLKNCILLESILQCHEGIHSGNIRDKIFSRENNSDSKKSMFLGAKNGDIIDNYLSFTSGWFVDYNEDLIDKKSGEYASLRDQKIFDLPKIYITRTGNPFKAFIDETNYASNNFFSIQFKNYEINSITNLIPVLGLLNSSFANYFIRKIVAPSLGNTFIETKIIHLLKLPLPSDLFDSILLIDKVNQILLAKKSSPNADTSTLEAEIDRLVYELYRLTEEEIRIVEKNEK